MKTLVLGIGGFRNLPVDENETEIQFFVIYINRVPVVLMLVLMPQ